MSDITPSDRLGLTLSIAILIHAIILLGVHFTKEDPPLTRYTSMEVVLVQQESKQPNEAKLLAQTNLEGRGEIGENTNIGAPPAPFPDQKPQLTRSTITEKKSPQTSASKRDVALPAPTKQEIIDTITVENEHSFVATAKLIDEPNKEKKITKQLKIKTAKTKPTLEQKPVKKKIESPENPSATKLLTNSFEIASLNAEIRNKLKNKTKRPNPKRKRISANTKEFKYAAYMEGWRAKVERIGNINYPEKARQQKLSGSLLLDVALNQDGSINEIIVRRSSGKKILDDAAIRIVELAAPYAPFPENFKDETDILHILRTWQFTNQKGLR